MEGEPDHREARVVVPVQDADAGALVQELPALEVAMGNSVNGGAERNGKGEGPLQDPGLAG